jgi:hypothetical protein
MFEEPNNKKNQRYFPDELEIMVLTNNMILFYSFSERDPRRSQIVDQCSAALHQRSPQWTPRNVRIYFNNHKKDLLQFSSSSLDSSKKSKSDEKHIIIEINNNVAAPDKSHQINDPLCNEPEILLTNSPLFLEPHASSRYPFIRVAKLEHPISAFYSNQNCNNELPQNTADNFTYLDELLINFNYKEPNLLEQIPEKLENLNDDHIVFILENLQNGSLSQRQMMRHFGINYVLVKQFLIDHGFQSMNLTKGRLETVISADLEQLVIQYRNKFAKGYQTICKTLQHKGFSVTETQIRTIFDNYNLWKYKKSKEKKKIHNKRYVAFYCNMEWHIDLHTWNAINPENKVVPQYLFAVIDDLTRYILFTKVLENKTMELTAMALKECIKITKCKPYIIATDNCKEFTGKRFEDVLLKHHIHHYNTHPYTPEENAKLERWWGILEGAIINPQDLELLVKEYNFNWPHKELERITRKKMTAADAWKNFERYEGKSEERLIFILW